MKNPLYVLVFAFCIASTLPAAAFAFDCDRKVEVGDSKYEVAQKCGDPTYKDNTQIGRIRKTANTVEQVYVSVEQWLYNQGSNRFVVVVTFEDGHVAGMRSHGYGRSADEVPDMNKRVELGVPKVLVMFLFGPPTDKDERVKTSVVSHKNGFTVPQTSFVEEWTYNLGPNRFLRIYHFVDGRLTRIVRGDKGF